MSYYIDGIITKDRVVLSKAITLIESTLPEHKVIANQLIDYCFKLKKQSKRIGITGSPGVGKSTFINALGRAILEQNKTIAVLAIDPSSSLTKGSILGDKTRMYEIATHKNVYIRPTASGTKLGGLAQHTFETILLCEAFGFDYILVETVGVGQSEIDVSYLVDIFLLLILPNSGDELQGIKRGVMELADMIIIHKADKHNEQAAKISAAQIRSILPLLSDNLKHWKNVILLASSTENRGIDKVLNHITQFFSNVDINEIRREQLLKWKMNLVNQLIKEKLEANSSVQDAISNFLSNNEFSQQQLDEFSKKIEKLI